MNSGRGGGSVVTYARGEVGVGLDIATAELDDLAELALLDNLVLLTLLLLGFPSPGTSTGCGSRSRRRCCCFAGTSSTSSSGSSGRLLRLLWCREGEHRQHLSGEEQAVRQLHGCGVVGLVCFSNFRGR